MGKTKKSEKKSDKKVKKDKKNKKDKNSSSSSSSEEIAIDPEVQKAAVAVASTFGVSLFIKLDQ